MARWTHLKKRARIVTVEPLLLIYMFADVLSDPTKMALVYEKVCHRIAANDTSVCSNLSQNPEIERQVQTDASHWFLYTGLCFEVPSIFVAFFYGTLSDRFSRKLTLILPVIGQILAIINWLVCSMYPSSPLVYLLIGPSVSGLFGGWVTLVAACMSYLSEVSPAESRTFRIAIAESAISIPIALALFVSGVYLEATSYQVVMSTTMVLFFITVLYTCLWMYEPERSMSKTQGSMCGEVLSIKTVKDTFGAVFRKRENGLRKQMILLCLAHFVGYISTQPSYSLAYLFTKKEPLSWSQSLYGYFSGYQTAVRSVGLLLIGPLLQTRFGMCDVSVMILSLVSNAMGEMLFGFSTTTWMVFIVPVISLFAYAKTTCKRALMSTMVERHELGQMFAVFGSLQSLSIMIGHNIYNYLYPATLTFWPGLSFFIGACLAVIPLFLYIWVYRDIRKHVLVRVELIEPGLDVKVEDNVTKHTEIHVQEEQMSLMDNMEDSDEVT